MDLGFQVVDVVPVVFLHVLLILDDDVWVSLGVPSHCNAEPVAMLLPGNCPLQRPSSWPAMTACALPTLQIRQSYKAWSTLKAVP